VCGLSGRFHAVYAAMKPIVVAGAMAHSEMERPLIDFVPCYRTAAGTGCAMAFGVAKGERITPRRERTLRAS
jgi:hypothetical protein